LFENFAEVANISSSNFVQRLLPQQVGYTIFSNLC